VQRGVELGAPLDPNLVLLPVEDEACGVCDRLPVAPERIAEAGMIDPIAYRAQVER